MGLDTGAAGCDSVLGRRLPSVELVGDGCTRAGGELGAGRGGDADGVGTDDAGDRGGDANGVGAGGTELAGDRGGDA